jgi:hypothetical protein
MLHALKLWVDPFNGIGGWLVSLIDNHWGGRIRVTCVPAAVLPLAGLMWVGTGGTGLDPLTKLQGEE